MDNPVPVLLALIVATIVAAGSLIQAYVSWQGRNDYLRATLIFQTAQRCAEANTATLNYVSAVQNYKYNREDLDSVLFYVIEKLTIIDTVLSAQSELTKDATDIGISQFRKLNDEITSAKNDTQLKRLAADVTALHNQVRASCTRLLRTLSTR